MSTVSQRVPTLLLGISQQPDNKKFPGQVQEALNAYPDFVDGLVKRPGAEYMGNLFNGGYNNSFYFNIVRDDAEKYVGQYDITAEQFKMWKIPFPRQIDNIFDQPELLEQKGVEHFYQQNATTVTSYTTNYDTEADTYNTALQDVQLKLGSLNEKQYDYKIILDGQNPTVDDIFEVTETYNNAGQLTQTLYSGITLNSQGIYRVVDAGVVQGAPSATLPAGYALGKDRTDEYPLLTRNGEKIYEANKTIAAAYNATDLANALTDLNTAETNYTTAVTTLDTAKTDLTTAVTANNSLIPVGGYLDTVTNPSDISVLNVIDKTFVINKKVIAQMDPTTPSAGDVLEAFVVFDVIAGGSTYVIRLTWRNTGGTVVGYDYQVTASITNPSADSVINALVSLINNGSGVAPGTSTAGSGGELAHDIIASRVGNGIHLIRPSSGGNYGGLVFDIETYGSANKEGLYSFQQTISTAAKLPVQCVDGYRVKVSNSSEVNADDYYVKFVADNQLLGYGPGSWEETIAPSITYIIDPTTMPHELIRKANGHFELKPAVWEDRIVGDDDTNPIPSFIGRTIESAFIYRNRLGFLSGQSIILSRADSFYNFWNKTALTVSDDDPVDLDCTSTKPQTLRFVVPQSTGLVIFGQDEQFILNTAADILSPKTAKINRLSNFSTSEIVSPIDTGIAIGFVNQASANTRHFEIFDISTDISPKAAETSLPVSDLIPSGINIYKNDPNLSVFALAVKGESTIYLYRYLQQGDKRSVEGWFKWNHADLLQDFFFDKGSLYVVTRDSDDQLHLSRIALQQHSVNGTVRTAALSASAFGILEQISNLAEYYERRTDVKLDDWYPGGYRVYDSTNDTTRIYAPYTQFNRVVAFDRFTLDGNDLISDRHTEASLFEVNSLSAGTNSSYVDLPGDLRAAFVFVGTSYNMEVTLPRPYVLSKGGDSITADTNANLIIHRFKINTGFTGPLKYRVVITGRTTFEENNTVVFPPSYNANKLPVVTEGVHSIPIYQRNENFLLTLIGDSPYPVTLASYDWEGRYTTNFYQRLG